tara:strand:+ start:294 stop:596 length:303 start_codon:yes stop_codon:yes gene_type:complete
MAKNSKKTTLKSISKLSGEEFEKLKSIANDFTILQAKFGEVRIHRINLNNQLKKIDETEVELETLFQQLQDVERDTMNSLTEKYGNVELDLKTGEIKAKS